MQLLMQMEEKFLKRQFEADFFSGSAKNTEVSSFLEIVSCSANSGPLSVVMVFTAPKFLKGSSISMTAEATPLAFLPSGRFRIIEKEVDQSYPAKFHTQSTYTRCSILLMASHRWVSARWRYPSVVLTWWCPQSLLIT